MRVSRLSAWQGEFTVSAEPLKASKARFGDPGEFLWKRMRTSVTEFQNGFENRNVLITGGMGFLGSNLAIKLVNLGATVTLVDSLIPEYGGNLFNISGLKDRVRFNISDVRDEHSLRYLVQGQDFLFNLAGQTSHLDSMQNPFTDLEINCKTQLS